MPAVRPERGYRAVNPATGELVKTYPSATDAGVGEAIRVAAQRYLVWRELPIAERVAVVRRIGELFVEHQDTLARIASIEMGKPLAEARDEVAFCHTIFEYFAEHGETLAADQPIPTVMEGSAVVQKRPIGTILGIMPWNYPYYQVARLVAPNLVLGNTILLKHAESVPGCAVAIEELIRDAGAPEGVYTNLFASHDQVERIISDSRVVGVSLTGSERAGAAVGALAGKNLKKCVLELGGSDPYIVLDAEDVVVAADLAWDTRVANTGQACNSNKRMIVADSIFDGFVSRLVERAERVRPGSPLEDEPDTFAPLSSRAAAERLDEQVRDAVSKGATLHAGGVLADGPTAYFSPAVLTGVSPEMRAYHEELFGPVAVVYPVGSDDDAVALANSSPYGLGGAVFSGDVERAQRVAERLDVGMANVNAPSNEGAEVPFGGVKRSGFGRELGPLAMEEFVNKRLFYVAT